MIVGDNPIKNPEDDAIGRISTAQNFVQHVLSLDTKEGVVVGVLGPWGSGKTSFINLARNEFEKEEVPILDFNPWMFSGRDRVEKALDEQGASGRDYLEKILQVAFDLPVVPSHILDQQITSALDNVLNNIENSGSLDEEVWPYVFKEIIRPLVQKCEMFDDTPLPSTAL